MLIESKIRREGGTPVQMGDKLYEFKPASAAPDAPHVCEVEDDEHIARLLGIAEGFKLAASKLKKEATKDVAASAAADTATTAAATGEGASTGAASTANADAAAGAGSDAPPSMVIKNGRKKIDLAAMKKKALLAFAKAEGFEVDKKADEAAIRTEIHKQATAG